MDLETKHEEDDGDAEEAVEELFSRWRLIELVAGGQTSDKRC